MTTRGDLLCFLPEANVTEAYALELGVAEAAAEIFANVRILGCSRDLRPLCAAMSAEGLTIESSQRSRNRVCTSCILVRKSAQRQTHLEWEQMGAFTDPGDATRASGFTATVTRDNYMDVTFHGIAVGRYATYVPLLMAKADRVDRDERIWNAYLVELETIVRVVLMSERALDRIAPDSVLTANHFYGTHRAFLAVARSRGISSWGLTPGALLPGRTSSALLFPEEKSGQTLALSHAIRMSQTHPLTDTEIHLVSRHMKALREGTDPWVYSTGASGKSPLTVRSMLDVRRDSAVVTVLLSSPDEMRAAGVADAEFRIGERAGHLDSARFLDSILACAAAMPDVDFVVRMHPRMVPNKRESITSPEMARLREALSGAPGNVHVCRPDSGISLYENILISRAAINYTSSSGLEFLSFGIPVLHMDDLRLGAYPAELGTSVADPHVLAQNVREAIRTDFSLTRVISAARWWAAVLIRISVFPFGIPTEGEGLEEGMSQDAAPSQVSRGPARFVPAFVKKSLEPWYLAWTRMRLRFPKPVGAASKDLDLVMNAGSTGEVWEPVIISRGRVLPDEASAMRNVLRTAVDELGWFTLTEEEREGVGTVSSLIQSLEEHH